MSYVAEDSTNFCRLFYKCCKLSFSHSLGQKPYASHLLFKDAYINHLICWMTCCRVSKHVSLRALTSDHFSSFSSLDSLSSELHSYSSQPGSHSLKLSFSSTTEYDHLYMQMSAYSALQCENSLFEMVCELFPESHQESMTCVYGWELWNPSSSWALWQQSLIEILVSCTTQFKNYAMLKESKTNLTWEWWRITLQKACNLF